MSGGGEVESGGAGPDSPFAGGQTCQNRILLLPLAQSCGQHGLLHDLDING
jgi:hypothetical protein